MQSVHSFLVNAMFIIFLFFYILSIGKPSFEFKEKRREGDIPSVFLKRMQSCIYFIGGLNDSSRCAKECFCYDGKGNGR